MKKVLILIFAFVLIFASCMTTADIESEVSSKASKNESSEHDSRVDKSEDSADLESSDDTESGVDDEGSSDAEGSDSTEISDTEDVSQDDDRSDVDDEKMNNYTYFKGVWLTQFDLLNIHLSNGVQRDRESFVELSRTVFNNIKNDGYNSVIVQVRPYADSYYPSEYYPVSNYVSGTFGNEDIYDPIEILVELAHECELEFHAWLNPMRGMKDTEIIDVPDKYPIKQWYNDADLRSKYLSLYNGRYYLNPAYDEVRKLIANGAYEVTSRYEIDGVHIDDYFYPTTDLAFDAISYSEYIAKGGNMSLAEFRYNNLDLMVSSMYSAIKSADKDAVFGISPAGNIDNTYKLMYADVYKWCSEPGYLDYICPQIYFGLEHATHDFVKIYNVWRSIVTQEGIRIYVGMTLGKAESGVDNYAGSGKDEWANNKDVLKRCVEYLSARGECSGVVLFCYQHMYDPITGESVEKTAEERANLKSSLLNLGN